MEAGDRAKAGELRVAITHSFADDDESLAAGGTWLVK
jgi:hypothetical protein